MQVFQNDIERFEKLGLQFPLLVDDGTIRKLYGKGRITYIIDSSGTVRYVYKGMPDDANDGGGISSLSELE